VNQENENVKESASERERAGEEHIEETLNDEHSNTGV
jgi:hypothetical protein